MHVSDNNIKDQKQICVNLPFVRERGSKMATIEDVAKLAGVSTMTVSRVMNGSSAVSEKTREKVLEAKEKLDYQPNLLARGLVTNRTHTIGVLLTYIENPLYSVFLSGIIQEAEKHGYDIIMSAAADLEGTLKSVNTLYNKCVDGMIILSVEYRERKGDDTTLFEAIQRMQAFDREFEMIAAKQKPIPVITLGDHNMNYVSGLVSIDYRLGGQMAIEYLHQCNHKYIGYFSHVITDAGIWGERYQGFLDGMRTCHKEVREDWLVKCVDTVDGGFQAMRNFIHTAKTLPTAISCANDMMAVGVINAAITEGLRIPEDISVIGHDGSYVGEMTEPGLTTVSIRPYAVGRACFSVLHDCLSNKRTTKKAVITPEILERRSVKVRS